MTIKRTFDLLSRFKEFPDTIGKMTISDKRNGKWLPHNTDEYIENANNLSYGFLALGLNKGDKIATITNNRSEWNFVDMGMSQIGVSHVPIHPTFNNEGFRQILEHSDCKLVFVSDANLFKMISSIISNIPAIKHIYTFDEVSNAKNWKEILELGKKASVYYKDEVERLKSEITENDINTIIYTSGTTGVSKGVMLSHKNLISNAITAAKLQHLDYGNKVLSFLPLSHVFELMTGYQYQYKGISVYYAQSITSISADIKELQVDGFITVPRLLESIYMKILSTAHEMKGIKRIIINWAINLAFEFKPYNENTWFYNLKHKIADKLVYKKWRDALSHNLKFIGCGGASLQPKLAKLFWAAGLPVFEGYGLTETSPIITVNYYQPDFVRLGTVGKVIENVKVRIADDGEILVKGPNVMVGYYKNQELTDEVIDKDGWFHTGDIGTFDQDGFLRITDRKKEIFKMSNGKYIAPQMIETKLKESFFIEQTMVIGENEKYASALISPNFSSLKDWCAKHKIPYKDFNELIDFPKVKQLFQSEIERFNKSVAKWEQIKKFKLVVDKWSSQTGELSPTLKLRRKEIIKKYHYIVEEIYSNDRHFS